MAKQHNYQAEIKWTGNKGSGTSGYKEYSRDHIVKINGKADILGSSDPAFQGDNSKHNPEELFLIALSQCHMLWYLHLCSDENIIVMEYTDHATGVMTEDNISGGKFTSVTLNPLVTITEASKIERANQLHHDANKKCFIANSINFPVEHKPTCRVLF